MLPHAYIHTYVIKSTHNMKYDIYQYSTTNFLAHIQLNTWVTNSLQHATHPHTQIYTHSHTQSKRNRCQPEEASVGSI